MTASCDEAAARKALGELCEIYWRPLYCFLRRRGNGPEESIDLVQGFIVHLLEDGNLRGASPERGRFRSFLLGALKHFVANQQRHDRALKRGGGRAALSLDATSAESDMHIELTDNRTPESIYARHWARTLLDACCTRLGMIYSEEGKGALFENLSPMLGGEKLGANYKDAAAELGMTEGALKVAAYRLRARYGDLLRAAVTATVENAADADDELRYLIDALS